MVMCGTWRMAGLLFLKFDNFYLHQMFQLVEIMHFIPILSYSCYCYSAGCARGDTKSPGFDFSWDVDNNSSF